MKRSNNRTLNSGSRRYSESISKQFNRSRIAKELDNFFDSFDDDGDDEDDMLGIGYGNETKRECDDHVNVSPAVITPSSSSSSNNTTKKNRDERFNHLMDPEFDPIKDRCDSDAFLFADEKMNLEAQGSQRKLRMQQWYAAETQLEKLPFIQKRVPIVDDLEEEERFEIRNQVSLLLEDQEDQAEDQDDSKQKVSQTSQDTEVSSQVQQQDDTKLQASETIRQDAADSSSPAEDQEEQNVEQGSMIDGFSVIEPSKSPQKQMLISYATNQFEELPGLITLSMSSSDTNCEEATHSSKSNVSYAKSHLSYDDTQTITPSIAFFLNTSKQVLQSDSGTQRLSPHQLYRPSQDVISNLRSIDTSEDDESHTAMGFSRGSSKYTTDSPRILELRERKRVIERRMEKIAAKYPALIEVDKYSF